MLPSSVNYDFLCVLISLMCETFLLLLGLERIETILMYLKEKK